MKIKFFTALAALAIALTAAAEGPKDFEVKLWKHGAPTKNGLENRTEEVNQNNGHTANVSAPTLHVYPADKPSGKAIICCPGGAYAFLAMRHEGTDMAKWMNKQGITFAVLKYRMPNGRKEVPLEDSRQAIKMMRDSALVWGLDAEQVGIMGSSAGGHFAATLATMYGDKMYRPDFQILLYPVISMGETTHQGSRDNLLGRNPSSADIEKYTLQNRVTPDTPRAFVILSSDDDVVDPLNSMDYVAALLANKVPVALHMYPTGGHGFGYSENFVFKRNWTDELETWLRSF